MNQAMKTDEARGGQVSCACEENEEKKESGEIGAETHTILYLHGFLSSPASSKVTDLQAGVDAWNRSIEAVEAQPSEKGLGKALKEDLEEERQKESRHVRFVLTAPDLNVPPPLVDAYLRALAQTYDPARLTIVGSSLGGFYAGRLANITGARVVLLNPCLNPWAFVKTETGERTIYATDRRIVVEDRFADDFEALAQAVSPVPKQLERTLSVLSTADEVLDWRLAWDALEGARIILSAGDDHRISRFSHFVEPVLQFAADALIER